MIIDIQSGLFNQQKGYFIGNVPIYNFSIFITEIPFLVIKLALIGKRAEAGRTGKRAFSNPTSKRAKITIAKVDC